MKRHIVHVSEYICSSVQGTRDEHELFSPLDSSFRNLPRTRIIPPAEVLMFTLLYVYLYFSQICYTHTETAIISMCMIWTCFENSLPSKFDEPPSTFMRNNAGAAIWSFFDLLQSSVQCLIFLSLGMEWYIYLLWLCTLTNFLLLSSSFVVVVLFIWHGGEKMKIFQLNFLHRSISLSGDNAISNVIPSSCTLSVKWSIVVVECWLEKRGRESAERRRPNPDSLSQIFSGLKSWELFIPKGHPVKKAEPLWQDIIHGREGYMRTT